MPLISILMNCLEKMDLGYLGRQNDRITNKINAVSDLIARNRRG
jgi:hypothetical protein